MLIIKHIINNIKLIILKMCLLILNIYTLCENTALFSERRYILITRQVLSSIIIYIIVINIPIKIPIIKSIFIYFS